MEFERKNILFLSGAVLLLLLAGINLALRGKVKTYKNLYLRAAEDLKAVQEMSDEVRRLGGFDREGFLPPDLSLFSYIEEIARNSDILLDSVTPLSSDERGSVRNISVSISAREVPMDSLVKFLYGIEYDSRYFLRVDRLHIKQSFKDRTKLDLKMDISAVQKK